MTRSLSLTLALLATMGGAQAGPGLLRMSFARLVVRCRPGCSRHCAPQGSAGRAVA